MANLTKYEIADRWMRAAKTGPDEQTKVAIAHAVETLLPEAAISELAVSVDDPPVLIVLRDEALFLLSMLASEGEAGKTSTTMACEHLAVDPARASLAVSQDWIDTTDGVVAGLSLRHRWRLRITGRGEVVFIGHHRVSRFDRGPDEAQTLAIALAKALGWAVPGYVPER